MKILIVDDSPAIQAIVRRGLQKEGFASAEFKTASNGEAALEIVQSWVPDLVITDWHMPGMSGLELLQTLRQTLQEGIQVGFVTTESVPDRLQEALRNGAAFILAKPFTDRQLADAVLQALPPENPEDAAETPAQASAADFRVNDVVLLEDYLHQTLKAKVRLNELVAVDFDSMATPWYIAFYGQGAEADVRGFCILDKEALLLIGGRLAGLTPAQLRAATAVPEAACNQVAAMLKFSGHQLFASPDKVVPLLRSQMLHQISPKVREIVAKGQGRKVYHINVAGFSLGKITLLAH